MLFAVFFTFWRFMEIITLIPIVGMLAWFVNGYVASNQMTPAYVLVLFIVAVIALAWAIFTLFAYHRSSTNALFIAVMDLAFVGAFIAGVWYLRFIASVDCTRAVRDPNWYINFGNLGSVSGPSYDLDTNKGCAMLKASWAFAIMNCIFFFFTAVLAWMHGDRLAAEQKRHYRETHSHRHRHRSGSHHSGSHRSHRSSHSHRRVYV